MKVTFSEEKVLIDTYPEAEREELPMFAENRVHQRTSGNPYPNKVVLEAQRSVREKREYTLLRLQNEFLEIGILPELGGKIWYAKDLKNGYEFFYKNNVVKPALIGVLGSWTSGGLEFNWPFHHRASTFMPVDYSVERDENSVTVWLSEHDPMDRMKGMVGVCLREGECIFETKTKVDNLTPLRRSFLWWENAAVPVNENYNIFFPEDVNYVRFHYKRSVTTYPIANNEQFGAYNGFLFDGDTDISRHKNTRPATSYFSAESEYDFFGGYDDGKQAGVVHVADHHISPGKKLFTWGYNQLSRTWERALTDNDGQYAELMAGCYSDNQPDFAWLAPYETKTFSQRWFPIHGKGKPSFANEHGALYVNGEGVAAQSVRALKGARAVVIRSGKKEERTLDLPAYEAVTLFAGDASGATVELYEGDRLLMRYRPFLGARKIPSPRAELPDFKSVKTAQELYLEGLHMEQYRSPEYSAEACYKEALLRDGEHAPSLEALAELSLKKLDYEEALCYARRAVDSLTRFNARTESGRAYYLQGLALLGLQRFDEGYDSLYRAAWCYDTASCAFLHLGLLDLRRKDYLRAEEHFRRSLSGNGTSVVAEAFLGYARLLAGGNGRENLLSALEKDKLNLFARAFLALSDGDFTSFCDGIRTDAEQDALDLSEYLLEAGLVRETLALLGGIAKYRKPGFSANCLVAALTGERAEEGEVGIAYPSRACELWALKTLCARDPQNGKTAYLLGCLLYGKGQLAAGAKEFERVARLTGDYAAWRACAVSRYRFGDKAGAREAMALAAEKSASKQITFESAYLMFKTGEPPEKIARFLLARGYDRDDLAVELARAYNLSGEPQRALDVLLSRNFVACEGGEHYIADEYMFAYYLLGKERFLRGDYEGAAEAFLSAQTLPQSLGSGLWNEAKLVPYRYFRAQCLLRLGRKEEAEGILRGFLKFRFDYFSDMYLPTLAYYVARADELLGARGEGEKLVSRRKAELERARRLQDTGFFSTTPFFLSFVDDSAEARKLACAYPLMLYAKFLGDEEGEAEYRAEVSSDGYGLYPEDFTV